MKRLCGSKDLMIAACLWVAVLALPVPATAAVIDTDTYLGHTYYLLDGKPWLAQEAEAITLGGHLVTINDDAENTWVWDTFGGPYGLFFGFNDLAVEGNWVWASGEAVTFIAWRAGEPNNANGNEDFGELGVGDYKWNDVTPQHTWMAVVEVGAAPTEVPEPTSLLLLGTGLAGFVAKARRRQKQR
jgi:PEP-CTERM motif/Lectin C-type domain